MPPPPAFNATPDPLLDSTKEKNPGKGGEEGFSLPGFHQAGNGKIQGKCTASAAQEIILPYNVLLQL